MLRGFLRKAFNAVSVFKDKVVSFAERFNLAAMRFLIDHSFLNLSLKEEARQSVRFLAHHYHKAKRMGQDYAFNYLHDKNLTGDFAPKPTTGTALKLTRQLLPPLLSIVPAVMASPLGPTAIAAGLLATVIMVDQYAKSKFSAGDFIPRPALPSVF